MAPKPGEANHVALRSPGLSAGSQRVSDKARRTGADGSVVPGLALSVLTASVLTGRPAVVVVAGSVQGALAVVDALSSRAPDQRVSSVARRTGADRSVSPGPVKPSLALGSGAAGVGATQVLLLERSTADEGVASVTLGT